MRGGLAAVPGALPSKGQIYRRHIEKFATNAHVREAVRSEVMQVVGNEILEVLSDNDKYIKYISARWETYIWYSALPPYSTIINGRFNPVQWAANPNRRSNFFDSHESVTIPNSDTINGFPGAVGRIEGIVRRLDNVEEGDKLQPGEILVTVTTNVG